MSFYSKIAGNYDHIFPLNPKQASFVNAHSSINYKLLDIACGTGSLAIELASSYKEIIGIDSNAEMLNIANNKNENEHVSFAEVGMMDIDTHFASTIFDTITCLGNSIVHLDSLESIELFFKKVKKILAKDGKFLFQLINYDKILGREIKGLPPIKNDKITFTRDYSMNAPYIDFSTTLTVKETGEEIKNTVQLFPARKAEIETALVNAGFAYVNSFSTFIGGAYKLKKLPLIFECSH